jgi:ubiquinone/menaquinone biosynthesis C-methylase UbiE
MKTFVKVILWILGFFLVFQVLMRIFRKTIHFPAPAFMGKFLDSKWRRTVQPPQQIIQRSGFQPGMKVLEVGCGSGCYTTFVARAVGGNGEVYALDIQPGMLEQLQKKLAQPEYSDIQNIHLVEHSAYELPFEDETFDIVYFITVLQEIPDAVQALREARRVLKQGGIAAVTEMLPDPDYVPASITARMGEKAGLTLDQSLGNLWTYTVRLKK